MLTWILVKLLSFGAACTHIFVVLGSGIAFGLHRFYDLWVSMSYNVGLCSRFQTVNQNMGQNKAID